MSLDTTLTHPTANDGYASYYAEKLWSWVPEIYRTLDAEPPQNDVLRALIELVAEEAAILRRDIDRLWDDQAIELCDDWAVAYLGALVSVTPLSQVNARGNRLAAGRAIAYQRRKGTPTVIGMAIRDIAGVEGVVVEAFRRLTRFPHRLDVEFGGVFAVEQHVEDQHGQARIPFASADASAVVPRLVTANDYRKWPPPLN